MTADDTIGAGDEQSSALAGIDRLRGKKETREHFRGRPQPGSLAGGQGREEEWGDFQTPYSLAERICRLVAGKGVFPEVLIEPTCGKGNFIAAALNTFESLRLVYGVELQKKYAGDLKSALSSLPLKGHRPEAAIELYEDDVFTHHFSRQVFQSRSILVLGNPPWVTNSKLCAIHAHNMPQKGNVKHLKGVDAITGKSNFDLGEFIVLRMLDIFSEHHGVMAMLCKNSVIRNIIEVLPARRYAVRNIFSYDIDAKKEFGASVDAALLMLEMGERAETYFCSAAKFDSPGTVTRTYGWSGARFVSDMKRYEKVHELDGKSHIEWRQGIKHDCARIMELDCRDGILSNGNGEHVIVEEERLFCLLKSSDLRTAAIHQARKRVIVTQRRIGENTDHLRQDAPLLWNYLMIHAASFDARRSGIYRGKPRFSIFGIGDYSFTPYKVGISGLYRNPLFSLITPLEKKPVMLDDTCYFIGFDTYLDALFTATVLNSRLVREFLQSIVFNDAKRPYTKDVLMRIDVKRAARLIDFGTIVELWHEYGVNPGGCVTEKNYEEYRRLFS